MKKTAFNIALFCCLLLSVPAAARQKDGIPAVNPVVKWENSLGRLTDSHWGVNDMAKATKKKNEKRPPFSDNWNLESSVFTIKVLWSRGLTMRQGHGKKM